MAGSGATLAILPAGTANLFASNLGIPDDIAEAVQVGLNGRRRKLDLGKINGEHFAVMAGAGLDARMIRDADGGPKDRFGRLAYIWTASKNLRVEPFEATHRGQRRPLVRGHASCLLFGNVGALFGGIEAFDERVARGRPARARRDATPRVSASGRARSRARRSARPRSRRSSRRRRRRRSTVEFDRKVLYELDGGDRKKVKHLKVKVEAGGPHRRRPGAGREHRLARHGDVGAHGRRPAETLASTGGSGS